MGKKHWALYFLLAILTAAILCLSLVDVCPVLQAVLPAIKINRATISDFIRSLGVWGPLGSIALMIIHSFVPFPAEFLTMTNGMVFGAFWGIVITWTGAMLGAYASFGLTRLFGRPLVKKFLNPSQLAKMDNWMLQQGTVPLLLSRLLPVISFNLINYGAGLTKISWWSFTWTTGIGILPITILMVFVGNSFNVLPWWAWLLMLLGIAGTTYGIFSIRKKCG